MGKKWAVLAGMGFELVALVLCGTYVGRFLDQRYHWNGMGVLAGCMLALVGWLVHFFVLVRKLEQEPDDDGSKK